MLRPLVIVGTLVVLGSHPGGAASRSSGPPLGDVEVTWTKIGTLPGAPTALVTHPTRRGLYAATKDGWVWALRGDTSVTVLDLSRDVTDQKDKPKFNEQGLLDIAFSPDGRYLYCYFTDAVGDTRIRSYAMSGTEPDASTARDILWVDQPHPWHNGGRLLFGPDGHLYIGVGDGGPRFGPNAQRLDSLLGKILRIDPTPNGARPYVVPEDNPFAGKRNARPEIFAYGVRNPWRFTFDRGVLWLADVGENDWEEVNAVPIGRAAGANFGWNAFEGPEPFVPRPNNRQNVTTLSSSVHRAPDFAYRHPERGCRAVVGGAVYRGDRVPELVGAYVFADLCDGTVRALSADGTTITGYRVFDEGIRLPTSIGVDADGELYVLSLTGDIFRMDPP